MMVDFNQRTIFEYLSLAAREPVYSAALAWVLGPRSPLPLQQRLAIITCLSPIDTNGIQSIDATTEWNDIDILLTLHKETGKAYVAIENKIKATEGKQQLANYDQRLIALPGTVNKVFLTLGGELPQSGGGWRPVPYAVLHNALRTQTASDNFYVSDLCSALSRLVAVAAAAREPGIAAVVFDDDGAQNDQAHIVSYIEEMRLKKVVQRFWMKELAEMLRVPHPWRVVLDETRGQALFDVAALLLDLPGYLVGLQLQWRTLKAFCAPYPYPARASDDQHQTVEAILERIRHGFALNENATPSRPRARGFRSFSVAKLPPGRNFDQWVAILQPQLTNLVESFPQAQHLRTGAIPTDADDD